MTGKLCDLFLFGEKNNKSEAQTDAEYSNDNDKIATKMVFRLIIFLM